MRQLTRLLTLLVLAGCADFERERPEAVAPSVQAGIEAQLAAREYRASENAEGLQAPNRAHNLRTYFDSTGIRVHDRTAGGSPELLKLSLSRVGREGALADVAPGSEVVADESRVEIRRPGLVEWFVNGPDGLEQGFTLAEKPRGDGKLVLELQLEGAKAKRRGKSLVFVTETGRKLAYGKLAAWDAHGDPLAAKLQLAGADRIAVSVDDAGAAYPILIDPLLQETADALVQGEQPLAQLGSSVASAGDVNGDGYADVIVGAPSFDSGSVNEGAALIFHGGPDGIPDAGPLSAQTQLEGNQPSAVLGDSVASAGDVNGDGYADVIVGAPGYDHGQLDEGMAVVFLGSASGVADGNPTSAHAQLESDQVGAQFGSSVASAGDVNGDGYADVIVGDPLYDNNNALSAGAAFVFLGSASGVADGNPASAHASLTSASTDSRLGTSVASAGDVNGDGYDDLIVSAPRINSTWTGEGFVLIYMGSAQGVRSGGLSVAASILRSDQLNAHIGDSVASAGDVNGDGYADVIVGASSYDFANLTDTGAAFVFLGSASGVVSIGTPSNAHAKLWGNQTGGALGQSVASAGDVNGDGYADVIGGAYGYDNPTDYEGSAFVYLGSENGLPSGTPNHAFAQLESDQAAAFFGWSVASAGDVNGDGYDDVIVGAPNFDDGENAEGAAFVFLGSASGLSPTAAWSG
ncbi:MAG TPA: integrin alpha, partial [Gemmatimonadaceae bacterium]|nr:integrin alpha [Gemmatimonadaceae bacterium]